MKTTKNYVSLESFEELASYYFNYVDTKPFNAYYERPATLSLLPNVSGKKVLDAGCAAGWYTKWLVDQGADVIAIDLSPKMVELTKLRLGSQKACVQVANLNEPLPFIDDQSIDIIVSSLTMHYLKDWHQVLNEFNRILKPNGTLVISIHHPFMDFHYFKRDNYFINELLEDEWDTEAGKVKVNFYRRPLSNIINTIINHQFNIHTILEPMPTQQFKMVNPKGYERLTKKPQFLFIKAIKNEAGF